MVRAYRQKLGITQEELAWRADMHRTYLADIERGARNITLRSVANLAHALQLSVEDLLAQTLRADVLLNLPGATGEILLVEDNLADVELTLRAFRRAKFANSIIVARDGAEALQYLFRTGRHAERPPGQPQLVLLDLELPKISGLEVLRQIRANRTTKATPVVVLTDSRQNSSILECSRLGAASYIVKPVDFESFAQITSQLNFNWRLVPPEPAARPAGSPGRTG